ncbi:MAG: DUF1684 domain-containing protein [Bacteroidetes bacterium]|nr:DUF1684 domain-containing protein [Bacteroidota bacterium]
MIFLKDEHSPLGKADTSFLRFYVADSSYRVSAVFHSVKDTVGFDMLTHSGVKKKYFVYGYLLFHLKDHYCKLFVYQSEKLRTQKGLEDYLFVPFQDDTNYETTFGGGRYLDFKISDIREGILVLDFNKAYNPYCAYKADIIVRFHPVKTICILKYLQGSSCTERRRRRIPIEFEPFCKYLKA